MFDSLKLGAVPDAEDWRELEGCSKVKTHYLCLLLVDFHLIVVSEKFEHVKILLKVVPFLVEDVSSMFMEFEGPRPASGVDLDKRGS